MISVPTAATPPPASPPTRNPTREELEKAIGHNLRPNGNAVGTRERRSASSVDLDTDSLDSKLLRRQSAWVGSDTGNSPKLRALKGTSFAVSKDIRGNIQEQAHANTCQYFKEMVVTESNVRQWIGDFSGLTEAQLNLVTSAVASSFRTEVEVCAVYPFEMAVISACLTRLPQETLCSTVTEWARAKKEEAEKAKLPIRREICEKPLPTSEPLPGCTGRSNTPPSTPLIPPPGPIAPAGIVPGKRDAPIGRPPPLVKAGGAMLNSTSSGGISGSGGGEIPSPEEFSQLTRKGDVLQLNRILKTVDMPTFMNQCVDPRTGYNPLHMACECGHHQIVHLLLKKRADPTTVAIQEQAYALHLFLNVGLKKSLESQKPVKGDDPDDGEPKHSFIMPIVQRLLNGVPINAQLKTGSYNS